MKRVYLDCEFLRDNFSPQGLASIAIVIDDDHYYAVNADMDVHELHNGANSSFMVPEVWKHFPRKEGDVLDETHTDVKKYTTIRDDIESFFEYHSHTGDAGQDFRMLARCGGQDVVRLHTFWNHKFEEMPRSIPSMIAYDLSALCKDLVLEFGPVEFPQQDPETLHHALYDALNEQKIDHFIQNYRSQAAP